MNDKTLEVMQRAMAIIIAEHEVMRECLVEHGLVQPGIPIKWAVGPDAGKNIVNLKEVIDNFIKEINVDKFIKEINAPQ